MAKKSEKQKYHSLTQKVVSGIIAGCLTLYLVAMVIGMSLYGLALTKRSRELAFDLAAQASTSVTHGADALGLSKAVMDTYYSLSDEETALCGTPEYREFYSHIPTSNGSTYNRLYHMMSSFLEHGNVYAVYLAMYDEKNSRLVYIVDPDLNDPLMPGDWESVNRKGMEKFFNWDGKSILYDSGNTAEYGWMCTCGTPIYNANGKIAAFVLVDITFNNIKGELLSFALQLSVAMLIISVVIAYIMAQKLKKNVTDPINQISEAAVKYADDKKAGVSVTEHFSDLNINSHNELERLSNIMANMEKDLQNYDDRIATIAAEKERIGVELRTASLIQQGMLPHDFPDRPEFSIYASMDPAKEVGGDFFDFFLIDEDHLGLVIADVSGKGVPAALFMMVSKVIIKNCAMLGRSAAETLTRTNEAICSNNKAEMFVTVWMAVLEISTGKLTAANAGHEYPAIMRSGGQFELFKDKHGLVVGGMDGINYRDYEIQLNPGDKLFVYTDGIPEATSKDVKLFGSERMLEALNREPEAPPEKITRNVTAAVNDFVKDAEQFDDMTMLCIEYNGK